MARRGKKGKSVGVILLLLVILGVGGYFTWDMFFKGKDLEEIIDDIKDKPKLQIIDESSKSRPLAVVINNIGAARPYHSGLQDAYLTYEFIVEGGISRLIALYKDKDTTRVGSVRSARSYFIDYALENDAIFVHYGGSDGALADINSHGVDSLNGTYITSCFYRDTSLNVSSEHTAFTDLTKVKETAIEKGYKMTTDTKVPLNYSIEEINLNEFEEAFEAYEIDVNYSYGLTPGYLYDSENKVYNRYVNDVKQIDYTTGNQYNYKNIFVLKVENFAITNDDKGRQELANVGEGEGYFITNGYARKIKWKKASRSAKTTYTYLDGSEVKVNDGNTFINIQPLGRDLTIEGFNAPAE